MNPNDSQNKAGAPNSSISKDKNVDASIVELKAKNEALEAIVANLVKKVDALEKSKVSTTPQPKPAPKKQTMPTPPFEVECKKYLPQLPFFKLRIEGVMVKKSASDLMEDEELQALVVERKLSHVAKPVK